MPKTFDEIKQEVKLPLAILIAYKIGVLPDVWGTLTAEDCAEVCQLAQAHPGLLATARSKMIGPIRGYNQAIELLKQEKFRNLLASELCTAALRFIDSLGKARDLYDLLPKEDMGAQTRASRKKSNLELRELVLEKAIELIRGIDEWEMFTQWADLRNSEAIRARWIQRGATVAAISHDLGRVARRAETAIEREAVIARMHALAKDFKTGLHFFWNFAGSPYFYEYARMWLIPLAKSLHDCELLMFELDPTLDAYKKIIDRMVQLAEETVSPELAKAE